MRVEVGINKVLGEKQIGLSDKSRGCLEGNIRMFELSEAWMPERKFRGLHLPGEAALNCWAGGPWGTALGSISAHSGLEKRCCCHPVGVPWLNQDHIRNQGKRTTHSGICRFQQQLAAFEDCVWLRNPIRTILFWADIWNHLGVGILVFPREILKVLVVSVFQPFTGLMLLTSE